MNLAIREQRSRIGGLVALVAFSMSLSIATPVTTPVKAVGCPATGWIDWSPPQSYPNSASLTSSYTYAQEALGTIQMPDCTTVYVKLTGEIVNPLVGGPGPNCTGYCGPSGFSSDNTTRNDFWQQFPVSNNGAAFISNNVPTLPSNGDHIGLVGSSSGGVQAQRLQFFSDSQRTTPAQVSNIVMLVGSLGGMGPGSWAFSQDFALLSDNKSVAGGSGFTRTRSGSDYVLTGTEGAGAIQFVGLFTEFTWSVQVPEIWASWNIGVTSVAPPLMVLYDAQGGSNPTGGAVSTVVGGTMTSLPTTSRAQFEFLGWFTASTGGTKITTTTPHGQTGPFMLYAQWAPSTLIVTYDAQGGSTPSGGATSTPFGGTMSSLPTTSRPGYSFVGWFTASSGGTQVNTSDPHGFIADFTLYARWTPILVFVPPTTTTPPSTTPPTPSPVVDPTGELPRQRPGSGEVTEKGEEVPAEIFVENRSDLVMRGDDFELRLKGQCADGCAVTTTPEGREVISLQEQGLANVSGFGFQPGTLVYVWLFSEPRFLGELTVAADGTFTGRLPLGDIAPGEHTLQVNGTSFDGLNRSANLGVLVASMEMTLPVTGGGDDTAPWLLTFLVAGVLLIYVSRRSRPLSS